MRQVFITGASSDIGIETSKKYLENGFRVLGHYNRGQSRFFELVDTSENMDSIQIDFSNSVATEQTLELNEDLLRKTDVLINMAAISQPKPFFNITALDIMDTMNVNLITSILVMRSVIPGMIKRKWGRIVNIGSIGVKFGGGKSNFCYSLSKHSLEFFPADHKEWAAKNVFVMVQCTISVFQIVFLMVRQHNTYKFFRFPSILYGSQHLILYVCCSRMQ